MPLFSFPVRTQKMPDCRLDPARIIILAKMLQKKEHSNETSDLFYASAVSFSL
jgi:hypothetical protein